MAERGPHVPALPVQLLSFPHVSELLSITFLSLLSPTGLGGPEQLSPAHPSSWLQAPEYISQRNLLALGPQGEGLSCQRKERFPQRSEC